VPSSVESDGAPQYFVLMTKRISFYFERSYGQENVEVLLRPNMVRQMMHPIRVLPEEPFFSRTCRKSAKSARVK
jgi:hypothetical protein